MFSVTKPYKKNFSHCHVNVIHMRIIAFCIHFSIIACCPYLTFSSITIAISYAFLLHNVLFTSVLNIIHVFDLESVCFDSKHLYNNVLLLTCSISYFVLICGFHSFSSLSYDRSKASSKASSPHSAIKSFVFQMRVSSPFLKVIQ
jgi:hypothetical protein